MSQNRSAFSICVLILASLFASVHSACYLPNGTSPSDDYVQPCATDLSNPLSSTCCHTKWENPPGGDIKYGPTKDECMPNGLCRNRGSSTKEGEERPPWSHYYRVMCTDKDFKGCLDVCGTGLNAHDTVQLTPCDGTATSKKWCCGDNTDCCAAGVEYKALYIPQKLTSKSSALSVAPAPVQNQTLSSNSTSNSTSSEPPVAPPKGLSGGAKAGIGIGVVLGVILSLAAGFFAGYMAKRHWKRLDDPKGRAVEVDANQYDPNRYQYENKASVYASHELNNPRAQEIGGSHHMIHELADQGGVKN